MNWYHYERAFDGEQRIIDKYSVVESVWSNEVWKIMKKMGWNLLESSCIGGRKRRSVEQVSFLLSYEGRGIQLTDWLIDWLTNQMTNQPTVVLWKQTSYNHSIVITVWNGECISLSFINDLMCGWCWWCNRTQVWSHCSCLHHTMVQQLQQHSMAHYHHCHLISFHLQLAVSALSAQL